MHLGGRRIRHIRVEHFLGQGGMGDVYEGFDEKLRRLWISSLQSALFNQVVANRIDSLSHLMDGDLAWKHDSGAVFL